MNCETCQPLMLDLVYGEIDGEVERSTRAHLDHCPSCREAYRRLGATLGLVDELPLATPSEATTARIEAAARAHAERARGGAMEPEVKTPSVWQRAVDFLGRFAMGRQVAMASIFVLIVAIGLWYVPQLRREPEAAGGTVVNPDPGAEAAPSSDLTPAQPLDLVAERGRIRPKGAEAKEPPRARAEQMAREQDAYDDSEGEGEPAQREPRAPSAMSAQDDERARPRKSRSAFAEPPPPASETRRRAAAKPEAMSPRRAARRRSEMNDMKKRSAPPTAALGTTDETAGTGSDPALRALAEARAQRSAGRYAEAARRYETWLQRYGQHREAGRARLEAAECYRRLGRRADAERLLRRAARSEIAAVAAQAKRMLARSRQASADEAASSETAAEAEAQ